MTAEVTVKAGKGDQDVLVERISEPDGVVIGTVRLTLGEECDVKVGHTSSVRVSAVAKLSAARKTPA